MSRFLFYIGGLLLLEISVCNFPNYYLFADEDDEETEADAGEDEGESTESLENEIDDTKKRVHSIVDSLLKINKHVSSTVGDEKNKKSIKEKSIDKQIDSLRNDLDRLNKTLNKYYAEIEHSSGSEKANDTKNKNGEKKKAQKSKSKHKKSYGKRSSYSTKVYTVKNILSPPVMNRYLRNTNVTPSYKNYGKRSSGILGGGYTIKSYGNNQTTMGSYSSDVNRPMATKSENYFANESPCLSSKGCSS
ncbi:MAG: hypothetical protein LBQ08_01265 [Holosporaceae bacterium]|jgi:hypothetical protein|nr:hypothetical protein [Holosporaceae bacterium]